MQCFELRCTSSEPTRIFVNKNGHMSSSKIDYIITNAFDSSCTTQVVQPNLGDHLALIYNINLASQMIPVESEVKSFRKITNDGLTGLRSTVDALDFDTMYKLNINADNLFTKLMNMITGAIDINLPMLTETYTKNKYQKV